MSNIYPYPLQVEDIFEKYTIEQKLGQGFRGQTYLGLNSRGQRVAIKIPLIDVEGEQDEVTQRLNHIQNDIVREQLAWNRLKGNRKIAPYIAEVRKVGACIVSLRTNPDITYMVPYIAQEYVKGSSLEDWALARYSTPEGTFAGISEVSVWFELARKLAQIVGMIHAERVVHGDIWPPNIIMRDNSAEINPTLIDFGQAWLVERDFDQKTTKDRSYAYFAPERKTKGDVWRDSADIYSLGGVLYYLATGQEPPSVYKPGGKSRFKSSLEMKLKIHGDVRRVNPSLYDSNPGVVDIIHYCLRADADERAPFAEAVVDVIDLFEAAFGTTMTSGTSQDLGRKYRGLLASMKAYLKALQTVDSHLFYRFVGREIRFLQKQLQSVGTRVYSLEGNRETFVNGLLACISTLRRGDHCLALTTPTFWRKQNFGIDGRLLTMLKMAAWKGGVNVRWVLLLSESERIEDEVSDILDAQNRAAEELTQYRVNTQDWTIDGSGFFVGYVVVSDEERKEVARQARTFVLINRHNESKDNYTLIAPSYNRSEGRVTLVRFWDNPARTPEFRNDLEKYLEEAESILKYF